MNLLEDIKKIIKNDDEHMIKVEVAWDGVTVYLDYDPVKDFNEDCIIPIHYCTVDEFSYIPHDELVKLYRPSDYGMDLKEISLMKDIMKYLESHKKEIAKLCSGYDFENRKKTETERDIENGREQ